MGDGRCRWATGDGAFWESTRCAVAIRGLPIRRKILAQKGFKAMTRQRKAAHVLPVFVGNVDTLPAIPAVWSQAAPDPTRRDER